MRNIILTICLFSFIVCGCKKEDTEPSDKEEITQKVKLLTKIVAKGPISDTRLLSYDSSNRLISLESIDTKTGYKYFKNNFTYFKDGRLYTMDNNGKTSYDEYIHFKDSTLVTTKYYSNIEESLQYVFYYSSTGVVDSLYWVPARMVFRLKYDYKNNNLDFILTKGTSDVEYDDKNNAYLFFPVEYLILNRLNMGPNNATCYNSKNDSCSLIYKYDADNYPLECIKKYYSKEGGSNTLKYIDSLIFEYNTTLN